MKMHNDKNRISPEIMACRKRYPQMERRNSTFMFSAKDGKHVLYKLPRRSAMICVNAKAGSSRWKMLLHKAMGDI
jgi:hypothetical protein